MAKKITWYHAAEILGITKQAHAALMGECFKKSEKIPGIIRVPSIEISNS